MSQKLRKTNGGIFITALAVCLATTGTVIREGHSATLTDVNIGVVATSDYAPIYLGVKQGYFRKQGLNVIITTASTTTSIPAMFKGDMQFATGTPTNFFGSTANGLPIQFVSTVDTIKFNVPSLIAVGPDTGIKSMKQTAGKTFCLPAPGSGSQPLIQAWAERAGVDYKSLKFTVAPFATMVAAIQAHKCDGALIPSPFYEQGKAAGFVTLGNPFFAFGGVGVPNGVVVTTAAYSAAHPGIVKKFIKGLTQATLYAKKFPKAVRAILPSYTGITPDQANAAILPLYMSTLYVSSLQRMVNFTTKVGYINGSVDVRKQMIAPGALTKNK